MYELTDFYEYCQSHGIEVGLHPLPAAAMTLRDGGEYCVGLDFSKLGTIRALRTVTMHELGHLRTGALHKVDSPYQLVAQSEYRANAESFGRYLNPQMLRQAMRAGFREPWELAEYFDLDEACIRQALYYWTQCRGIAI